MVEHNDVHSAIAMRRTQSLTDIVRRELERMILSGELKSGERINEQMLASQLGVSRGPIREASRALERAGLVVSIINQGSYVREISHEETDEIYDMRSVLFGFACMRLASILTKGQKDELEALAAEMEAAVENADHEKYYELNLRFHNAIFVATNHTRLLQSYEALVKELHLSRRRSLIQLERMRESNREHRLLLNAMESGDALEARRIAEQHIQGGRRRWEKTRTEHTR